MNIFRALVPFVFLLCIFFADYSVYNNLKTLLNFKGFKVVYYAISFFSIAGLFTPLFMRSEKGVRNKYLNFVGALAFLFIIVKIFYAPFLVLNAALNKIGINTSYVLQSEPIPIIVLVGGLATILFFLWMLYGIIFGKYDYKVSTVKLKIANLPSAFQGFKVLQISDIHAGSFDSMKAVQKGIDLIKAQKADLIVFTGDLVNGSPHEIEPFYPLFSQLSASYGVYSCLGNHDYYQIRALKTRDRNEILNFFRKQHKAAGFELLINENRLIEKGGGKIALVGVENWGLPPFPQYGDLDQSLKGTEGELVRILLSHDPSHWDEKVIDNSELINLTLSGHTHAGQFGWNIFGWAWSPVKYKYPRWAGLYEKNDRFLYVNRGFGFLGFPGRVGMYPEISVFELQIP